MLKLGLRLLSGLGLGLRVIVIVSDNVRVGQDYGWVRG